jgi:hypothetical protein
MIHRLSETGWSLGQGLPVSTGATSLETSQAAKAVKTKVLTWIYPVT